jgi:hypothetical protein
MRPKAPTGRSLAVILLSISALLLATAGASAAPFAYRSSAGTQFNLRVRWIVTA